MRRSGHFGIVAGFAEKEVLAVETQAVASDIQTPCGLLNSLGEVAPEGGRIAQRLHDHPERRLRTEESLEREPREATSAITPIRHKERAAIWGQFPEQLLEAMAEREFRRELRQRQPRHASQECGGPRAPGRGSQQLDLAFRPDGQTDAQRAGHPQPLGHLRCYSEDLRQGVLAQRFWR